MELVRHHLSAFLPILIWTGFIFLLSNQPTLPGPELFTWDYVYKKSAHMFVYFVLFLLFYRALRMNKVTVVNASFLALAFTFTYALSDEFHQTFIPGRTGTIKDLGYDSLGMFIGWLKIHKYI